jgi:hypothetical protein
MKHSDQNSEGRGPENYASMTDDELAAVLMQMDGAGLDRLTRAVLGVEPAQEGEMIGIGAPTEWRFN